MSRPAALGCAIGCALLATLLAGCPALTELVVVIDTDLDTDDELDGLRYHVDGPNGTLDEGEELAPFDAEGRATLELATDGQRYSPVCIQAVGTMLGHDVVARQVTTGFEPGESRVLQLLLERRCVGCPGRNDCDEVCGATDVLAGEPFSGELPSRTLLAPHVCDPGACDWEKPRALAVGGARACMYREAGDIVCWGSDDRAPLGCEDVCTGGPCPVHSFDPPLEGQPFPLAVGREHACAAGISDTAWETVCWGDNTYHEVDGVVGMSSGHPPSPVPVASLSELPIDELSVGDRHSCARLSGSGTVVCWGEKTTGEDYDIDTPIQLGGLPATALVSGDAFACALVGGNVVCWGSNDQGQLGAESPLPATGPVVVAPAMRSSPATQLWASGMRACARFGAEVQCWGDNQVIQSIAFPSEAQGIGLGPTADCWWRGDQVSCSGAFGGEIDLLCDEPTCAWTLPAVGVLEIEGGDGHVCARTEDRVLCWGQQAGNRLGASLCSIDPPRPEQCCSDPAACDAASPCQLPQQVVRVPRAWSAPPPTDCRPPTP